VDKPILSVPQRILLVEDDVAGNVEDADHLWRVQPFDAVLLDLNLPASASASATSGLRASVAFAAAAV